MQVTVPPEFESFAREWIATGEVATLEEAVARVLRIYLAEVEEMRASVDEGLNSGEPVDGKAVFAGLRSKYRAMAQAADVDA